MEKLMTKAIMQFKKEHKNAEIRTCAVWESYGCRDKIKYALFHIEYVDDYGGEYKHVNIQIKND